MDVADRAQMDTDFFEAHRDKPVTKEAEETGFCLFCGEPLSEGRRWCDKVCRDLWSKERERENHYKLFR